MASARHIMKTSDRTVGGPFAQAAAAFVPEDFDAWPRCSEKEEENIRLSGILRGHQTDISIHPFDLPVLGWPIQGRPEPADPSNGEDKPAPEPNAAQLRAQWEEEQRRKLEIEVERAREEGYEQGRRDALAEAEALRQEELEGFREACAADAARLRALWDELIRESEPLLADIAIALGEAILDGPLTPTLRDVVGRAVAQAVERLAGDGMITISLHPADYLRMQENGIADQLAATHTALKWNTDPECRPGDWSVESPFALIRSLREELINDFVHRLGLPGSAESAEPPTGNQP